LEYNINIDLQEVGGIGGLDGVDPGSGEVAGNCEYGKELSGSKKMQDISRLDTNLG
jgi:hypothetical protein